MALPWIFRDGFENASTVATATSGTLVSFPHFTDLARFGMPPYRGAYAMRVKLAGGTTSQFIREDTAFDDWVNATTRFVRFYFYLGKDLVMADTDKFSLFEAESTVDAVTQFAVGIRRNSGNLEVWYNQTQAAATPSTIILGTTVTALGQWFCLELKGVLQTGGTGTIDVYLNDSIGATQITALTNAAIVDAKFGVIGPDAGTSGTVLIDDIVYDDTQVFMDKPRYRNVNATVRQTADHPLIGPGRFSVAVTGTAADAAVALYDSDGVPNNLEPFAVISQLTGGGGKEMVPGHDIFAVTKGVYCVLSGVIGSSPQAFFSIDCGGHVSDGALIQYGLKNGAPRV